MGLWEPGAVSEEETPAGAALLREAAAEPHCPLWASEEVQAA